MNVVKLHNQAVVFGWYSGGGWAYSSKPHTPTKGPMYSLVGSMMVPVEEVDRQYAHYLEDLLKLSLSESIKKRLKVAKVGTMIKVHQLGKTSSLWLKRLSPDEINALNKSEKCKTELKKVNGQISDLVGDLEVHKRELQETITKLGYT